MNDNASAQFIQNYIQANTELFAALMKQMVEMQKSLIDLLNKKY